MDAVLINNQLPKKQKKKYEEKDSLPVEVDSGEIKKLGVEIVAAKLIEDNKEGFVRHSPVRVAKNIYYWFKKSSKKNQYTIITKSTAMARNQAESSEENEEKRKENSKL